LSPEIFELAELLHAKDFLKEVFLKEVFDMSCQKLYLSTYNRQKKAVS